LFIPKKPKILILDSNPIELSPEDSRAKFVLPYRKKKIGVILIFLRFYINEFFQTESIINTSS